MKGNMICLVYVDDKILCGPNLDKINEEIRGLGIKGEDQVHSFQLKDEGQVGDFLGIRIEKLGPGTFNLTQSGLTNKVLAAANMTDYNSVPTPNSTVFLSIDAEGDRFDEDWEYATVLGMLVYLAQNSRPDISYAVHQCARFTHAPRKSHVIGKKLGLGTFN